MLIYIIARAEEYYGRTIYCDEKAFVDVMEAQKYMWTHGDKLVMKQMILEVTNG